jgi:hypothetical protein
MVVTMTDARQDDRAGLDRYLDPTSTVPAACKISRVETGVVTTPVVEANTRTLERSTEQNGGELGVRHTERGAARQFLKNGLVRHLTYDVADAICRCGEISISGVVTGESNVRVNVCFRLDLPRATWDGLARTAKSQGRSRSAVIQRIARFIFRAGTARHDGDEDQKKALIEALHGEVVSMTPRLLA